MNQTDLLELAKAAIKRGDIAGAESFLKTNLENQDQFEITRLMLAEILLQRGTTAEAKTLLLEVEKRTPDHPHNLILLAYISRSERDYSQASKYLNLALNSKKLTQENLKFAADELVAIGDFSKAIQVLRHIDPMDPKCFHQFGYSYFKLGEFGKSLPIYRKLFASFPHNPHIARELSLVAAAFREYDTAIDAYRRYMQLITPTASDYLKFSDLELMNHNVEESERHLQKSFSLGETSIASKLLQAKIYRLKGEYSKSLVTAEEVVHAAPATGSAWSILAELVEKENIDKQLIELAKSALSTPKISPHDQELIQFAIAELHIKSREYSMAYQAMQDANSTKAKQLKSHGMEYCQETANHQFSEIMATFSEHRRFRASSSPLAPIFIVGMPRSGTTVINRIIESSGLFDCIGESEAIPYIHAQLQKSGSSLTEFLDTATTEDWEQIAKDYINRIGNPKKIPVDKMPSNFLYVGQILSMFPHARIIQLRRNPFDVCMSIFAKPFPEGHNYASNVEDLAHYYRLANSLMDFWAREFPENVWNLDFSHFIENPVDSGKKLFDFLGEKWNENYLLPPKKSTQNFTFSEIQVRRKISKLESMKWQPFTGIATDLMKSIEKEMQQTG